MINIEQSTSREYAGLVWNNRKQKYECFQRLGFTKLPQSVTEIERAVQQCVVDSSSEWKHVLDLRAQCAKYMNMLKNKVV